MVLTSSDTELCINLCFWSSHSASWSNETRVTRNSSL